MQRREFLTYTGAGVGALLLTRSLAACQPQNPTVFSGNVDLPNGFTVPAGGLAVFDPNNSTTVTVSKNVVVRGELRMKPANPGVVHTLRFTNVDEAAFVGGHTTTPQATDVGLWVLDGGLLTAQGSPKAGWNRTGDHSTWTTSDELIVAPNGTGVATDTPFASFTKGGVVPSVTHQGVVYKTEVANLTRNVRIEGTPGGRSHIIFLQTTQPQTLKNIAIRHMGPQQFIGVEGNGTRFWQAVQGRYGLHFHMDGDGSRGSTVESVVVRDCGGPAFVAHLSNGVTFTDCISYRSVYKAFWWDEGTSSDDILYDHCAALQVLAPSAKQVTGFHLNAATNSSCINSVAVGCMGVQLGATGGFRWPEGDWGDWGFTGCTAHNNQCAGVSGWQNTRPPQHNLLENFVSYRNGFGLADGAYFNTYVYRNAICFGNTPTATSTDVMHSAAGATFDHCTFDKVTLTSHHAFVDSPVAKYLDCKIGTVVVNEPEDGIDIEFHSTTPASDLTLSDFQIVQKKSDITVYNSNGSSFTV